MPAGSLALFLLLFVQPILCSSVTFKKTATEHAEGLFIASCVIRRRHLHVDDSGEGGENAGAGDGFPGRMAPRRMTTKRKRKMMKRVLM